MLRTRVITALVLLAFLLPALFAASPWPFALVSLVAIGAAAWEWGRLNGKPPVAVALGVVVALACALALASGWNESAPAALWWIATALWVLGGAAAVRGGPAAWPAFPAAVRLAIGAVLLAVAWLAIVGARTIGINFLLSVLCLVWMADVAAYFGGRAFGRRKLSPAISPGKSWEGVWSGLAGALLLGAIWMLWVDRSFAIDSPSLYGHLWQRLGAIGFALVVVFLASMSVVGDLFESLVKRAAGAKDSSSLLPGHGGVLDRIDALLPVFPIAMAMASL